MLAWRLLDQRSEGYWDDLDSHTHITSDVNDTVEPKTGTLECSLHLEQNTTRVTSFNEQFTLLRRPYIVDAYTRQLYLEILATHPDFQGRGHASELVRWGVEKAREMGVKTVTVVCEQQVVRFYRENGFVELDEVDVRRLVEGVLRFEAMRFGG